jgi:DNA adenine methylase
MYSSSKTADVLMAKPFLKWVGGKSRVLPELIARLPPRINKYYEFFLGSGALFFHLQPSRAFLSDINLELINCYQVLRNRPEELFCHLQIFQNTEQQYYKIRSWDRDPNFRLNTPSLSRAARFIYLNKTCYNGLWRENSAGQNNSPYGRYANPNITNWQVLSACSTALQNATITAHNMRYSPEIWHDIHYEPNDFVYLDPPYIPVSGNFTGYSRLGFSLEDHTKLRDYCQHLDNLGVKFLLSNSYSEKSLELYKNFHIEIIEVGRAVNCQGSGRGKVQEVLVRNY